MPNNLAIVAPFALRALAPSGARGSGHNTRMLVPICTAITAASGFAFAQPIPFVASTIDATHSGDCKAIADLDGDGKGDAIVGGYQLCWYASGTGFTKHTIRSQPIYGEFTTDMQAADLDGDGDIDLILGDGSGPGNLLWFENPRLATPAGVGSDPRVGANWLVRVIGTHGATVHDVEVADLDRDGRLDVVSSGHAMTRVWKQITPTSWQNKDLSSLAGMGVFLGDVDADQFKDIATPRGWIRNPQNLIGGNWVFYPISAASTGDECLLADLNHDGRLDLITCDAHQPLAMVWCQAPALPTSPTWTKRTIDGAMGAHHPEAVDFDLDGDMDILMGLEITDLSIYINSGAAVPTFLKQRLSTTSGHNARFGDIDGDGLQDVLGSDYIGNPPVRIFINQLSLATCTADFDGDGDTGTDSDIEAFFTCLGGNCCGICGSPDFDGDGDTGTDADIEAFFRVLGGGSC